MTLNGPGFLSDREYGQAVVLLRALQLPIKLGVFMLYGPRFAGDEWFQGWREDFHAPGFPNSAANKRRKSEQAKG